MVDARAVIVGMMWDVSVEEGGVVSWDRRAGRIVLKCEGDCQKPEID